jgi:hypothetical protein
VRTDRRRVQAAHFVKDVSVSVRILARVVDETADGLSDIGQAMPLSDVFQELPYLDSRSTG